MKKVYSVADLRRALQCIRVSGKHIGLVPTMGALHRGHASLVRRSMEENDTTVVSIFLNPTQFNDPLDLERYPRTLDKDCILLQDIENDINKTIIVFAPSVEEIYPEPDTRVFSYPPTDSVMEGAFRPGHFNGVCQIVSKLFMMVEPEKAYFGEKDFQQIAVIRNMVADLKLPVEIVPCTVVREPSGLAMSSRNTLLSTEERATAANIFSVLRDSVAYSYSHSIVATHDYVVERINGIEGLEVQYFSIVDAHTLAAVTDWTSGHGVVGCITVFCGKKPIRLIDHIKYRI